MTNEKTPLDKLIEYAETAMADGYPYEVIGEDLSLTVKALRALRVEPTAPQNAALGVCAMSNRPVCGWYPNCVCGRADRKPPALPANVVAGDYWPRRPADHEIKEMLAAPGCVVPGFTSTGAQRLHNSHPEMRPRVFRGNGPDCLECGKVIAEHLTGYYFCPAPNRPAEPI